MPISHIPVDQHQHHAHTSMMPASPPALLLYDPIHTIRLTSPALPCTVSHPYPQPTSAPVRMPAYRLQEPSTESLHSKATTLPDTSPDHTPARSYSPVPQIDQHCQAPRTGTAPKFTNNKLHPELRSR